MNPSASPPLRVESSIRESSEAIPERYSVRKIMGRSRGGAVIFEVRDEEAKHRYALTVFDLQGDREECWDILNEIRIATNLRHCNIQSIFRFVASADPTKILTLSYSYQTTLATVINSNHIISDSHGQYIIYNVLRGLKYLHSAGLCHGSVSAANVALANVDDVFLINCGRPPPIGEVTYASPELLRHELTASPESDIWALGCLVGEVLRRLPLFPAVTPESQLGHIEEFFASSAKLFLPLRTSKEALNIVTNLLIEIPAMRLSASEALAHPFFRCLRSTSEEPTFSGDWQELDRNISTSDIIRHINDIQKLTNDLELMQSHDVDAEGENLS